MRQNVKGNILAQCLLLKLGEPKVLADYPFEWNQLTVTHKFINPNPHATVARIPAKNVAIGW